MAIDVIFDLFITNEYGVEKKATDNVKNYKETRKVGMLYNVCSFSLVDFDVAKSLSKDGEMRIRIERNIGGTSYSALYLIDELTVKTSGTIDIVGKTEGAKLFAPYMKESSEYINATTYNDLFIYLLGSISSTMRIQLLPNTISFYEMSNETYGSIIVELADKFGIDIYVKNSSIVFEPKKIITPNDIPVQSFLQKDGITASVTNKKSTGLGIVSINLQNADIESEASMALSVALEPQPVRPPNTRTWLDPQTTDRYSIVPQSCNMALLYNPLDAGVPKIVGSNFSHVSNYFYVEEFDLIEESCITLLGGITSIAGVTLTNGTETKYTNVGTVSYSTPASDDTILFMADYLNATDGIETNNVRIDVIESGLDQAISSSMSGSGTVQDPYVYEILLGSQENIISEYSEATMDIESAYSFTTLMESLKLTSKDKDSSLNGFLVKVDGTGATQTSGYSTNASETIFYLDPNKVYESIAKVIYLAILNATDLPYTAEILTVQEDLEFRAKQEVQTSAVFSNGVDEIYNGQRDNMALADFVINDANSDGILTVNPSTDTSNPSDLPPTMIFEGGGGDIQNITIAGIAFSFEKNHNILCFEEVVTGKLRVAYTTNAFVATVPNSEYVRNIPIKATHIDSYLKHIHEIRAIDYFPLSYVHRLDISDVWSIEPISARYAEITIKLVNNYSGSETFLGTKAGDSTGILLLHLGAYGYGQFALNVAGKETLYIKYYANSYQISFDKMIIKESTVTECN